MNASTPPAVSDILDRIDALGDDERDLLDLHLLRLREAEKERAREHLNALLREGLESGHDRAGARLLREEEAGAFGAARPSATVSLALPDVSVRAELDVNELANYLARADTAVAVRFLDAVEATYRDIAAAPLMSSEYPAGDSRFPPLRKRAVAGFRNHLVFHRAGGSIRIERVLHARRDLLTELADV